jgi:hypothetical protein
MSETRTLIRLLRIYFPRISEFGPASEFRGGGGYNPQTPPRYATGYVIVIHNDTRSTKYQNFQHLLLSAQRLSERNAFSGHLQWEAREGHEEGRVVVIRTKISTKPIQDTVQ